MEDDINLLEYNWQIPAYKTLMWRNRIHDHCVIIPVINEGNRIQNLLKRMFKINISDKADIIIVDAGSNDGSLDLDTLKSLNVKGLLVKTGSGKLSSQLLCAYAFALKQGYQGIITIDGNNKDDPDPIPHFIDALKNGIDLVQASRFVKGGVAENTPKLRNFGIRHIHAPVLSFASGFKWTDTTQGFRGYSRRIFFDPRVAPFRAIFTTYNLLTYLSYRLPKLGYKCIEMPSARRYPKGKVPTKISVFKGNWAIIIILIRTCLGHYNPY